VAHDGGVGEERPLELAAVTRLLAGNCSQNGAVFTPRRRDDLPTAVDSLRLGGSTRMLADVAPDMEEPEMERLYARFGWHEIGRSRRGWRRPVPGTS
jgi:hypothetical protein